jgi:hypothetical protein
VIKAATLAVWMTFLLRFMGYECEGPVRIYRDNLSTIWLARNDGSFNRTKHIIVKKYYLRERLEGGDIVMIHMNGLLLSADMLTKPMTEAKINEHSASMGMESLP